MNPKFRPLLEANVMAVVAFGVHYGLLKFLWTHRLSDWQYHIAAIYGFFYFCSMAIVSMLIRRKDKDINTVGSLFMLLTCIKTGLAYVMLHPILGRNHPEIGFEKINFFSVFAVFLAIETIVSVRMLQNGE